jgi:hypothetical protein
VSNTTVFALPSLGTDPVVRFHQQVEADLKRNDSERRPRDIEQGFPFTPAPRGSIPRRSRRSAWVPSEV